MKSGVFDVIEPHGLFLQIKDIHLHSHIPKSQFHFTILTINECITSSKEWSTKDDWNFIFRTHHNLGLKYHKINWVYEIPYLD